MSARDDYPYPLGQTYHGAVGNQWHEMCDEIDRLRVVANERMERWLDACADDPSIVTPAEMGYRLCCPVVWDAKRACNAYGAPSSHGCGLDPGHDGKHRCPCGSSGYPSAPDEVNEAET